jgi:hypothetical protein
MGAAAGSVAIGLGVGLSWGPWTRQWIRQGAVLDADFGSVRFALGGSTFGSLGEFLAAIGGSDAGDTIAIGPHALPGAVEQISNGDFSAPTQVLSNDGVGAVIGTIADNGDGTFTIAADSTGRFYFPLASMVNGRPYQVFIASVSALSGVAPVDFCDVGTTAITSIGPYIGAPASKSVYDNTYRFVDVATGPDQSLTITAPRLIYVEGWAAASGGSIAVSGGVLTLTGNAGNIPRFQQALALQKGHAYQFRGQQRTISQNPSWTVSSHPALFDPTAFHLPDNLPSLHVVESTFSADAAAMYVGGRFVANPADGTAEFDGASVKEVLPFAGFNQEGFAAIASGTTPSVAEGSKTVFEASCGGLDTGFIGHERNRVRLEWDVSTHLRLIVTNAGTEVASLDLGSVAPLTAFRVLFSVKANDFRAAQLGGPVLADTSGDLPGVAMLYLKRQNAPGATFDGTLDRLTLYPAPWSEAEFYEQQADATSIVAWGDSLTASANVTSESARYPAVAARAYSPERSILNFGIGAQSSTQIAARMGAQPIACTVTGDQIPAGGGIAVTAKSINVLYNSGNFTGAQTGWLADIYGTMSTDADGNWTFTRAIPGSVSACPPGAVFVPELAVRTRNRTHWLWLGRNGAQNGYTIEGDIAAAVARLGHPRYLVGAILTGAGDGPEGVASIQERNVILAATYGDRFVDVYAALRAAGDGSADDMADVSAGIVPRSLRSDGIHLNDAGYAIVAVTFKAANDAMGW